MTWASPGAHMELSFRGDGYFVSDILCTDGKPAKKTARTFYVSLGTFLCELCDVTHVHENNLSTSDENLSLGHMIELKV